TMAAMLGSRLAARALVGARIRQHLNLVWEDWRESVRAGVRAAAAFEAALLLVSLVVRFGAELPSAMANQGPGLLRVWGQWDWSWYRAIADSGYVANHPRESFPGVFQDAAAFAPGYPLSVRGVAAVLHIPDLAAGLGISFACTVVA